MQTLPIQVGLHKPTASLSAIGIVEPMPATRDSSGGPALIGLPVRVDRDLCVKAGRGLPPRLQGSSALKRRKIPGTSTITGLGIRSPNDAWAVGSTCYRACAAAAPRKTEANALPRMSVVNTPCVRLDTDGANPTQTCWISRGPYPRTRLPSLLLCETFPL